MHVFVRQLGAHHLEIRFSTPMKEVYFSFKEKRTCLAGNKDEYFVKEYMPKLWGYKDIAPFDKVFDETDYVKQ